MKLDLPNRLRGEGFTHLACNGLPVWHLHRLVLLHGVDDGQKKAVLVVIGPGDRHLDVVNENFVSVLVFDKVK